MIYDKRKIPKHLQQFFCPAEIGLEETLDEYIARLVKVFREVWRVLRPDGIAWLNLGDSFFGDSPARKASSESFSESWNPDLTRSRGGTRRSAARYGSFKPKDCMFVPHRVAMALQADGWWCRMDNVWAKANPMPDSTDDRPTRAHEYVFLLTKSGNTLFWTHRDGLRGTRTKPPADYRWIDQKNSTDDLQIEVAEPPPNWKHELYLNPETKVDEERWRRVNLWTGRDYFYDFDAVAEPLQSGPSDLRKMIEQRARIGGKTLDASDPTYKANASTNIGQKRGVGGNGGVRNLRSVWNINTVPFKGAHFAVFPPELAERCIKAGTSPGGCCSSCGGPYYRVVRVERGPRDDAGRTHSTEEHRMGKTPVPERGWESDRRTLGFSPTCGCDAQSVPCRVLDPFMGSGTAMAVAFKLGCDAVGYELNAEYIELAMRRAEIVERKTYGAIMRGEKPDLPPARAEIEDMPLFANVEDAS